jgi:multidrug efflux pump subunit AcrA (membrane-fusion protein)
VDRLHTRTLAPIAAIGLLAVTAAFVQLSPTPGYTSASPARTDGQTAPARAVATPPAAPTQPREQVITARRGTIIDTVNLAGRIGAADETPLSFVGPQRVGAIKVNPGDLVKEGQLLVEADQSELARSLGAARERLATASAKLRQAQEVVGRQQKRTEVRQTLVTSKAQQAIADAEAGLRLAEATYEKVKAGATTAERNAAETAVASARAALARADADLNKLREGSDNVELMLAQQSVMTAEAAYLKAQDDYQKLRNGPDPVALRTAERDLLTAQNTLSRAQADLQKLAQGDPIALSAAQREVERARAALRTAEIAASSSSSRSATGDAATSRMLQSERQSALLNARLNYQSAVERLQVLQAGPPPGELMMAQRNVATAQSAVDSARDRLNELRRGPDSFALAQGQMAVESSRVGYETAVAREQKLLQGVPGDQLTAAITARQGAEAALRTAEAQQAEILARPSPTDLATAEDAVRKARDVLAQARVEADLPPDDPSEQTLTDMNTLQLLVDQEQEAVNSLESDLLNARIVAPFDGRVVATTVRAKEGVDAGRPVVILAPADAESLVLADIPAADGARLTVGQQATIRYGGAASGEIDAPIASIVPLNGGLVHVDLRPTWPGTPPMLGSPASILIVAGQRQDVIILPEAALRGAGTTRVVDVLDGDERRQVTVTVGLVAGGEAEIVSGISEGTRVVLAE